MEERTTLVAETSLQRLLMEKALAMAQELERAGSAAPDGQVLEICESVAMREGHEFTRSALEGVLQREITDVEKKRLQAAFAVVATGVTTKGPRRARS